MQMLLECSFFLRQKKMRICKLSKYALANCSNLQLLNMFGKKTDPHVRTSRLREDVDHYSIAQVP